MKGHLYYLTAFLLFSYLPTFSQIDNTELQKMYNEDQSSRKVKDIDWTILLREDGLRRVRVYELIKEGKIITGKDYYNSAMIFLHANDTIASGMAIKQMKKAIELDSTINKKLLAAAIDRDLMRRNKPQIYGTQYLQFIVNGNKSKLERYKIDTTQVSDRERKQYNVETLAEQKIKERNMNLLSFSDYFEKSNSIGKTIKLIKSEKNKGDKSEYNVSESGINSFADALMDSDKNKEASKVFKLNTELYPQGYKTFDSYGECLLKLNKKKKGLKAYKKSLDLNPQNHNARKILDENK